MIHFQSAVIECVIIFSKLHHLQQGPAWSFYCFTSQNENNSEDKKTTEPLNPAKPPFSREEEELWSYSTTRTIITEETLTDWNTEVWLHQL